MLKIGRHIIVSVVLALLLMACGSDDADTANKVDGGGQDKPFGSEQRLLDTAKSSVERLVVTSYFSLDRYGATQVFYFFKNEKAILHLTMANTSMDFNLLASVLVFDEAEKLEDIEKWINNQHSDGIYADPAVPLLSYPLSAEQAQVVASSFVEAQSGYNGDEYEHYKVEVFFDNVLSEYFYLNSFNTTLPVFVKTKDVDLSSPNSF